MRCLRCRGTRGRLTTLPLTGEPVVVCDRCRGPVFLAHMHRLVVPHG